jgi:DNA-binding CsgD family transcriptional regulator
VLPPELSAPEFLIQLADQVRRHGGASFVTEDQAFVVLPLHALNSYQPFTLTGPRQRDVTMPALTERQIQVLKLIAQGKDYVDVAEELDLTYSTVANHLATIRTRFNVRTTKEAVQIARREGIFTDAPQ